MRITDVEHIAYVKYISISSMISYLCFKSDIVVDGHID